MGLGLAVYLGTDFSSRILVNAANNYYTQNLFYDLRLSSPHGFRQSDIDELSNTGRFEAVSGSYETFAWSRFNNSSYMTHFMAHTDKTNRINVVDGRLPQEADECAIELSLHTEDGLVIGDKIYVQPLPGQPSGLKNTELTVTGYITHPSALCTTREYNRGLTSYGDGIVYCYVVLDEAAFDKTVYGDIFTTVYIRIAGADAYDSFSGAYSEIVDEAKNEIAGMSPGWVISDRWGNQSFCNLDTSAGNLVGLSRAFAAIFIAVSAMITFAVLSRLIDEERRQTGVRKCFGFKNSEILVYFILYTLMSGIPGIITGISLGTAIQYFSGIGYLNDYILDSIELIFDPAAAFAAIGIMLALAALSTVIAVYSCAFEQPVTLLSGEKHTKNMSGILKRIIPGWRSLRSFTKAIISNAFAYPRRLFTVILGIAGSLALIIISLSLYSSVNDVPAEQEKITKYDRLITCEDINDVENQLKNIDGLDYTATREEHFSATLGGKKYVITLICPDADYQKFLGFADGKTQVTLPQNSAIACHKIAELDGLQTGDKLFLTDPYDNEYPLTVDGYFTNYTNLAIAISAQYYKEVFGNAPVMNQFYITFHEDISEDEQNNIMELISASQGFLFSKSSGRFTQSYINTSKSIISLVFCFIGISAVLLAAVIYNSVIMNLKQKRHEIAVLLINGYSMKDVKAYASNDFWFMAFIGLAAGYAIGYKMSQMIMPIAEGDYYRVIRTPNVYYCLAAVAITFALIYLFNAIAMRSIRKIRLSDAAA